MNRYRAALMGLFVAVFVSACATMDTGDIKVEAETAPGADLSKYKTYAWWASAQIINDPEGRWEPPHLDADAEIKYLIDRELRKRGLTEVASNPDMVVAFVAGVDMAALELKKDPKEKMEVLKNSPKGALAVIFIDASTGEAVWAAAAVGEVKADRSAEAVRKRLDYAVTEMFRKLPPS